MCNSWGDEKRPIYPEGIAFFFFPCRALRAVSWQATLHGVVVRSNYSVAIHPYCGQNRVTSTYLFDLSALTTSTRTLVLKS